MIVESIHVSGQQRRDYNFNRMGKKLYRREDIHEQFGYKNNLSRMLVNQGGNNFIRQFQYLIRYPWYDNRNC